MAFTNGKLVTDAVAAEKQPLDGDLTTIAGLTATTDSFIQAKSSAWAARTVAQVKTDLGLTGTNSGDQTITLTGVVTGSGTGSFATSFAADPVFTGSIYLGTATNVSGVGAAGFQVQGVGTAGNATIARFSNNITGPILSFAKSRAGSINTYTILTAGDIMGNLEFYGADGSTEILGARIQAFNLGTPAAGDVRAGFRFQTGSGAGAVTTRLTVFDTSIAAALPVTTTDYLTGGFTAHGAAVTALAFGSQNNCSLTPNSTRTLTTTVPPAGTACWLIVNTSGTTSYTLTFGTGFKTTGTLATGTVTAKTFTVSFISDGTSVIETARTVAM